MAGHDFLHITAILMACLVFAVTTLFTSGALGHKMGRVQEELLTLMAYQIKLPESLFANTSLSLADKYSLDSYQMDVTPAGWTFYITPLIYGWQALWLGYGLTTICRRVEGGAFYTSLPTQPPILYVVFSFSMACNVSWLLIWDRKYMEVALVFVNLMTCTLYICLVVSVRRLNEFGEVMCRLKLQKEIWVIRLLVQNGLATFATWGSVAAIYNFAVVLISNTGVNVDAGVGSTVSLTVFTLEIGAWWIMDNFVLEKYLRYLITPYLIILFSLVGIIEKNWDPSATNCIYTVTLALLVAVLFIIKVIMSFYRHRKRPLFSPEQKYRRPVVAFEVRNLLETAH